MKFFVCESVKPRYSAKFTNSKDVYSTFKDHLEGADRELFVCAFLNPKHQWIDSVILFSGTLDSCMVYPREICRAALTFNAAAVILIHNHPSGDPDPSQCDRDITRQCFAALKLISVTLLDHVIIGNGTYKSLSDLGEISEVETWTNRLFETVKIT